MTITKSNPTVPTPPESRELSDREIQSAVAREARITALREAVATLIDHGNSYDRSELLEALQQATDRSHRTLQQGFLGVVRDYLIWYGGKFSGGWYDLRNEAAVKWCAGLADWDSKRGGYEFPLI